MINKVIINKACTIELNSYNSLIEFIINFRRVAQFG